MESLRESIQERAQHKQEYDRRMKDKMMQSKEGNIDSSKALDAGLVVTERNETESERHVSSSRSGKDTHVEDADINFVNDKQLMAEVKLTAKHNIIANEQQHYEQSESIYDAYLLEKAQIQEKVFANVALKNELRKLKGNSVDTKFAKPSILGKPVLKLPRNQSVVRQQNAFKSERPNFLKPRFASQVDVNNVLSKPVTPYCLPKVREYVLAKPHHVIAPGSSRNSSKESCRTAMVSVDNTSGPVPQRKERSTLQYALSSKEEKSSCFRPFSSTMISSHMLRYYSHGSTVVHPAPEVIAPIAEVVAPELAASTGSPSSTTVDQDAPSPSNSQTTPETQFPIISNDVEEENHDLNVAHMNNDPFFGILIPKNNSESSSLDVIPTVVHTAAPNSKHITK
nr:hypothetical protein [Tanacetum cinerariifolium]